MAFAKLPAVDQATVDEVFALYDVKKTQALDFREFKSAMQCLGVSLDKPRVADLMSRHGVAPPNWRETAVDPDKPCHPVRMALPRAAFRQLAAEHLARRTPAEKADEAFDLFDTDGTGLITVDDLRRVVTELGQQKDEEELARMIDLYDITGKGGVDREEFRKFYMEHVANAK